MNIVSLSNLFNVLSNSHTEIKHYHFGWRSDINKNIANNFDASNSTGKMYPAVQFNVPDSISSKIETFTNSDSLEVVLFFDDLQDYNNTGSANTNTLLSQWANLHRIAKEFIYNVQSKLDSDYLGAYIDSDTFRFELDSNSHNDRLVTVKASFNVAFDSDCIDVDLAPETLPVEASNLYPVSSSYDYEDLNNLVPVDPAFDRCANIWAALNDADKCCILGKYVFNDLDCLTAQQEIDLSALLCISGCGLNFSAQTVALANQIQFNTNDTICIDATAGEYVAVEKIQEVGYIASSLAFDSTDYYYIHTANDTSIYKNGNNDNAKFYTFSSSDNLGYNAFGQLLIKDGFIYVETASGGANNVGTLVKIEIATGTATKLVDFSTVLGYSSVITNPTGNKDKVIIGGFIYLNCSKGGTSNKGTALKVDILTGAATVILNISSTLQSTESSKGHGTEYDNKYVLVYINRLFVYDTLTATSTDTQIFASSNNLSNSNDSTKLGNDFYVLYNSSSRLIRIDLATMTTVFNSPIGSNMFPVIMFYDAALNKIFIFDVFNNFRHSYDIASNTTQSDSTHTVTASLSRLNSRTQEGDKVYLTNGNSGSNQQIIIEYDILAKTSINLFDTQNPDAFIPDGVNFIDVGQAPLYLEKTN